MYVVQNDPDDWVNIRNDRAAEYLYVVGLALMYYDWVLSLPVEIDVIWRRRISLVSMLYVLLRYMSLAMILLHTVWGYDRSMTDEKCLRINLAVQLLVAFCIPCVQGIMLMRVCAIYGPSRYVLNVLRVAFVIEQLGLQTMALVTYNGKGAYGIESSISGYHNCNTFIPLQDAITAPWYFMQLTFETMLVSTSLFCLYRQMREVRSLYSGWDWSDLFASMIRDHTLYFVLYMIWGTLNGISNLSNSSAPFVRELLYNASNFWLGFIQQYILVPHLVLDVRQRYNDTLGTDDFNTYGLSTLTFASRQQAPMTTTSERSDSRA